jgi:transposase
MDLRERVVAAVKVEGLSRRAAAARFGVSYSAAIEWLKRVEETGSVKPRRVGGYKPKKLSGAWRDWLVERCRDRDFTLRGLVAELGERGLKVDYRSVWEFVQAEQDRADVARRRAQWRLYQGRIDPARLVFIDETWTKTNMAPLSGWAPIGQRIKAKVPNGHWKTMTFLAALRQDRVEAPWLIDGPINGERFLLYVEKVLAPTLKPGDIVVMDMCGRPRRCKKILFEEHGAWSGADMCPASDAAVTCRGPVWEFAERVQFNLARSRRVSMIWFSRSRLIDRSAILSVRPSHISAARSGSGLSCQSRCPVCPAPGH